MAEQKPSEPCYVISVAARMTKLHPQTLRHYERIGLIKPARSTGNRRLYSEADIERLHRISRLTEEHGVNLAGVEVILEMREEMDRMQTELEAEIRQLRRHLAQMRTRRS
jgi:MerR family transcriptional regulator/heat shock protein HspR